MIGRVVGSYEITAPIGKGAMGEVYEARHVTLGRRVAVKVLQGDHGKDDDAVRRFFNEARAASAVEHRGIVEVIDFGRDEDGSPFLVMELLDGESLAARLRRARPLPVDEALRITRQIASALGAAHARGIVHRDLKPDNVFLVSDPDVAGGARAKIVDFGIAKLIDPDLRASVATRTGAVMGTPVYMAPEQCRGSVEVDRRADFYSLGCILYEMLSGGPPFVREGLGDLLAAHMFDRPADLRDLRAEVPAGVGRVVERLLAKDREHRFASTAELLAALDDPSAVAAVPASSAGSAPDAFLDTLAPPPAKALSSTLSGAAAEVAPRPRRRRAAAIAIGALSVAAIALFVGLRAGSSREVLDSPSPVPAAENPEPLAVDLEIRDVDGNRSVLPGGTAYSGDRLQFFAEVSRPAHLYALQIASDGSVAVLHPIEEDLPLPRGARQRIPPGSDELFVLDEMVGDVHLLVIASPRPIGETDRGLATKFSAARDGSAQARELLDTFATQSGGSTATPQADGSLRVTGTGLVVYDFAFQHRSREGRPMGYDEAIETLTRGKTCEERKAAVAALRALGDPRAIPELKRARYRMRGGVLGIGQKNQNGCLKADAEAAIAFLGGA